MNLHELNFKRKFSLNLYKNLTILLGEMSFHKDFIHTNRGDPYPILQNDSAAEVISGDKWEVQGKIARLLGQHFPYATYEITLQALVGKCGILLRNQLIKAEMGLVRRNDGLAIYCGNDEIPLNESVYPLLLPQKGQSAG